MPLTPLHFSAIAPLHLKLPEVFDITALLFSSTLVDLELLIFFIMGQPMNHGIWHSYLFVLTIYPAAMSLVLLPAEKTFSQNISSVYKFFRFYPKKVKFPFKTIYFSCLIGGASHIFFDMWVHENSSYVLFPFYGGNPFWVGEWSIIVFLLVALLSLYSVFLWMRQLHSAS